MTSKEKNDSRLVFFSTQNLKRKLRRPADKDTLWAQMHKQMHYKTLPPANALKDRLADQKKKKIINIGVRSFKKCVQLYHVLNFSSTSK